jgi:hypothetical protein
MNLRRFKRYRWQKQIGEAAKQVNSTKREAWNVELRFFNAILEMIEGGRTEKPSGGLTTAIHHGKHLALDGCGT